MAQVLPVRARSATLAVNVIRQVEQWQAIRPQWDALFAKACNASAPLHYDWLANWWELFAPTYADGAAALRIVCFTREGELVGVLPLYQRKALKLSDGGRRLCFISTGEAEIEETCPDYLDLLCLAEVREACAELAWEVLCKDLSGDYDRLELSDMADTSSLVTRARRSGSENGLEIVPRGACPIADLAGGMEHYLTRLSANTRQQARRLLRAAQQAGAVLEAAESLPEAQAFFAELMELHQRRWLSAGKPGCFAEPPFVEFHRRLIAQWQPQGRVLLTRVRLGEQTIAVKYGFRVGDKFDFYQSGVRLDDDSPIKSPGIVSFLLMMQYLAEHGVTAFDFLRGASSYKHRLATSAQPLVLVRRIEWTWRTAIGVCSDVGGRVMRRIGKRIRGKGRCTAASRQSSPESENRP